MEFFVFFLVIAGLFLFTQAQQSEDPRSTMTYLLPMSIQHGLYAPFPVQSVATDSIGPLQSHNRRFYYASIIEVVDVSTTVYAMSCGPVGTAASWSSIDVCGTKLMGKDYITITKDESKWRFSASLEADGGPVTEVECNRISDRNGVSNTCTYKGAEGAVTADESNTPSSLFPEGFRHFTSMDTWRAYVTAGREKILSTSSGSTAAAPQVTGTIKRDVLFGAAGLAGAAAFGF